MTSGCTKQACNYRDDQQKLKEADVAVIGVSGDVVKNLKHFQEAYNLNFNLLSDVNGDLAKLFGVPIRDGGSITKKISGTNVLLNRGRTILRWTFILDKKGKIIYKDTAVNAAKDGNKVLAFIRNLKE